MVKEPFESGDFDENGDVDQNSQKSPRLPWKSNEEAKGPPPPLKVANIAKMARNRNGNFEGDGKFGENG